MFSQEIIDQIRAAKAARQAAEAEVEVEVEDGDEVEDEGFDPIRDIEVEVDHEVGRGLFLASW